MALIHPVVLCGGSGTRLWPRSRPSRPKPFLPLVGQRSLFEATLDRCSDEERFAPPVVVTGAGHVDHVLAQAADLPQAQVIVEPAARNTAPAIALAAARLPEDAVMLVCPSDHHIANVAAFRAAADAAARLAEQDWLVAFGIAATAPETGYGYILQGEALEGGFKVDRFVEKPDLETAMGFLADGRYSWNGGIFAMRAGTYLAELRNQRPDMAQAVVAAVEGGRETDRQFHPAATPIEAIEGESIDYAVMEGTARAAMVPVEMTWSDIGNWHALRDARPGDRQGNRVRGEAELVDCENLLVESDGPHVSVIGLKDVAVVVDGDEILVTSMDGAQRVGRLRGVAGRERKPE
jgi:mannose-1-phosphate guanylyltransferase/mannose-6-phosphate isomerase